MQAIHPYQIVLSLAGHDEGKLFVVTGIDGEFLLLADGKGRKLEAPKRKKKKHVRCVGTSAHPAIIRLHRGEPTTNKQLRCALAAFHDSDYPTNV
ncbi:MAG: KOW domain-containing RNA-binding protein [Oscillospiraceae bacterium]|nr:KOW domain-containing RNA-binding protein [Oscillospiraceae bacterium]